MGHCCYFPIYQKVKEVHVNLNMGVSKNRETPKMDGENNGKPY